MGTSYRFHPSTVIMRVLLGLLAGVGLVLIASSCSSDEQSADGATSTAPKSSQSNAAHNAAD
ncbi:MAG: hypothetical protein WD029_05430, partial [Microthrixaceae bacterium]